MPVRNAKSGSTPCSCSRIYKSNEWIWMWSSSMPSPDWIGQTLCVLYPFFSANSVATVGVRVYGWLRHSRWSHPCPANLVTLTAQKFRHLPFSKEVSHESVAGRPLWIRFTSTPCSFFELYVHCVRGLKTSFCVTGAADIAHFLIHMAGVALFARC